MSHVVRRRVRAPRWLRRWVAAIVASLAICSGTCPPAAAEPLLDLYDDPLPAGAIARLGTVRWRNNGHNQTAAFAPYGDDLCTTSSDRRLLFWDLQSGRIAAEYSTGAFYPRAFAWSPDGKQLAVLGFGSLPPENAPHCNVQIIDRESLRLVAAMTWPGRGNEGSDVAFLPDGETVVVGGGDGFLRILDITAEQVILTLQVFQRPIEGIAVSPDGETIALVASHEPLVLFRWLEQAEPLRGDIGERGALDVAFSADGATVALARTSTYGVPLHDGRTGAFRGSVPDRAEVDHLRAVCWSPDGRLLAASSAVHNAVVLYDATTHRELRRLPVSRTQPHSLSFSADSSLLAAVGSEARLRVWRVESGERLGAQFEGHEDHPAARLAWSADGSRIATGNWDGTARVWDAETGRPAFAVRHEDFVCGVAFSPDARFLVSSGFDDTVRFWQLPEGREVFRLAGHGRWGPIRRELRFTPDGAQCISWGGDMFLRSWTVANAKAAWEHDLQPAGVDFRAVEPGSDQAIEIRVDDAAFSPDGRQFALLFRQRAYVYDVRSGRETRQIDLPPGHSPRLAFADGQRLVTLQRAPPRVIALRPNGQAEHERVDELLIHVWNLESGELVREFAVPGRGFGDLAIAHDGVTLAVSSNVESTTIHLFDLSRGEEWHRIEDCPHIRSLAFSPDDRRLAADLLTGEALIWDVAGLGRLALGRRHDEQEERQ